VFAAVRQAVGITAGSPTHYMNFTNVDILLTLMMQLAAK